MNFFNKVLKVKIIIISFLILISLISLIIRLKNIGNLSLWMDEGFYYLAAQSILKFGYPLYPSGHILFKGILYSYFLSFVALLFGLNETSLRIFSVICSIGTISLLYFFGRKFINDVIALLSAIIIAFSTWETEYARTVLYFAPLQLFYLLAIYFFYKGFFENQKKYKYLSTIFFILIPFIHQLGMGVWFCFPALFLVKGVKNFFKKDTIFIFSLTSLTYILIQLHEYFFWHVGYVYSKSQKNLLNYFFEDFSFSYFKEIMKSFPHMGLIVFIGFFIFIGGYYLALRNGRDYSFYENWYFLNLIFFFPLLFLCFFRTHIQPRYLFQLRPLFILLYLISIWRISQIGSVLISTPFNLNSKNKSKFVNGIFSIILFALLFLFTVDQFGVGEVQKIINRNYRDRIYTDIITRSGRFMHYDHKGVGEYVRHYLKKDDIVIAIHVVFQYIYAGKVDYWLWTGGPGTWDAWEKTPEGWKDVYIGAKWINNLESLKKIISEYSDKRIWIITSPSIVRRDHIHRNIASFIRERNSDKLVFRGKDGISEVYLWHDKDKLFTRENHTFEAEWFPVLFGKTVYELSASKGCALYLDKGENKRSLINYSFERRFRPGKYELILRMKIDNKINKKILAITILNEKGERILYKFISGQKFIKENEYQKFKFYFFLHQESKIRLKILDFGENNIWIDYIDVISLNK